MHPILAQVNSFLAKSAQEAQIIPDKLIDDFGEACKTLLRKHFTEEHKNSFSIRMSNIGKPLCQLQMDAAGEARESMAPQDKMNLVYGDLVEALAMFVLKASGIKIHAEQKRVHLDIGGITLEGTLDLDNDEIWDIKSCSDYSFKHKFGTGNSFYGLLSDDSFGYVAQLVCYSEAEEKPAGGWIAINKNSGEWNILEFPKDDHEIRPRVLQETADKIVKLTGGAPFKRQFTEIEETFRRKLTGNTYLGMACSYCSHKNKCWGPLKFAPQPASEAQHPKWYYYIKLKEREDASCNS